jgi:hypothetical protein
VVTAFVAAGALMVTLTATGAAASSGAAASAGPEGKTTTVHTTSSTAARKAVSSTTVTWGPGATAAVKRKIADGVPLSSIPLASAADWVCTVTVGGTFPTNGVNGDLDGDATQFCSGSFGQQWLSGQFQRSSWSGWRTYSSWTDSQPTTASWIDVTFSVPCGGPGQGTYDYRLVAQGHGGGLTGPETYGTSLRIACGT